MSLGDCPVKEFRNSPLRHGETSRSFSLDLQHMVVRSPSLCARIDPNSNPGLVYGRRLFSLACSVPQCLRGESAGLTLRMS